MKSPKPSCNISVFEVLSVVLFSAISLGGSGLALASSHAARQSRVLAQPAPAPSTVNSMQLAFSRAVLTRHEDKPQRDARVHRE